MKLKHLKPAEEEEYEHYAAERRNQTWSRKCRHRRRNFR